ncbi:MAG TPA: peptidoglycan hydrolase [Rhodothermales bacterium]|nr:peptidoglycan hydrolase [Rhodothermales bacterium]
MNVNGIGPLPSPTGLPDAAHKPETGAEAAKQFEELLVREFVKVMTKDLFKTNLSGEEGPSWMGSYSDMQRDVMTNTLTKHLVDQNDLGLADLLARRWGLPSAEPGPDESTDKTLPGL